LPFRVKFSRHHAKIMTIFLLVKYPCKISFGHFSFSHSHLIASNKKARRSGLL